ncbi:MAG: thiamine-phosphate kinase [Hyphomicrobiales bacterium]|nr:thiamine-phosphate kinase [Hyphomicrobiales bacterium]MCP5373504.1 thiamine-phosphate kinase [Hyphomicrobiales bacterium]
MGAGGNRGDGQGEFAIIARHFAPLAAGEPGALGLLDDAAVLDIPPGQQVVVTTDCLVAGVHFLAEATAAEVAHRALAVNLSDLAAMGAAPRAYTLALALPENLRKSEDWIAAFSETLNAVQGEFGIVLAGGDTVSTPGPLTVTVTALGTVAAGRALRRGGAAAGEGVFVSGTVGDAALGLRVLRGGLGDLAEDHRAFLAERHRRPTPRLALGRALVGLATAAADVSDGLLADLGHICEASGLAARVEAARVPLSPAARAAVDGDPALLAEVLTGGDDYELVFTLPDGAVDEARRRAAGLGLAITAIGRTAPAGAAGAGVAAVDRDGAPLALAATGYRHF